MPSNRELIFIVQEIRGARVAVARLSDAPWIEDVAPSISERNALAIARNAQTRGGAGLLFEAEWKMGMAHQAVGCGLHLELHQSLLCGEQIFPLGFSER